MSEATLLRILAIESALSDDLGSTVELPTSIAGSAYSLGTAEGQYAIVVFIVRRLLSIGQLLITLINPRLVFRRVLWMVCFQIRVIAGSTAQQSDFLARSS